MAALGAKKALPSFLQQTQKGISIGPSALIQPRMLTPSVRAATCEQSPRQPHALAVSRRRTTATAIIAETVFLRIGVVGMAPDGKS